MNFKSLNNDNFMLYAVKHYDNPQCCGMEEFNEDSGRARIISPEEVSNIFLLIVYKKSCLQWANFDSTSKPEYTP